MRKGIAVAVFFSLVTAFALSDEKAVSTSGKQVLLRDDGTWTIVTQKSVATKDFRNCTGGMTRKNVLKAEGLKEADLSYNDQKAIAVNSTIGGLSCQVIFIFAYDKLVRSKYYISESHTNNNIYIESDYPRLKNLLNNKYGQATDEGTIWSNDLYKDDPQDWGTALSFGHLSFHTQWDTEKTQVYLYLSGDNFKVTFGIEYTSKEWRDLEQKQQEEETSSKL